MNSELDAHQELLSKIFESLTSDEIPTIVAGAGLAVDWVLSKKQDYSHKTRIREYRARVYDAYSKLSPQAKDTFVAKLKSRLGLANGGESGTGLDPLLRINNRGMYDKDLPRLWEEQVKDGSPLSLIEVDIDNFKQFNDKFGHEVGDRVLQQTASVLKSVAKGKGGVYKYGGEELVILLPNFSLDEAASTAERARLQVADMTVENCPDRVTVSSGVSNYPETTTEKSELFQQADAAMYHSKVHGKNRVTKAQSKSPNFTKKRRGLISETDWKTFIDVATRMLSETADVREGPILRILVKPEYGVDCADRSLIWDSRLLVYKGDLFHTPAFARHGTGVSVVENPGPHHRFLFFGSLPAVFYQSGLEESMFFGTNKVYGFWQIARVLDAVVELAGAFFTKLEPTGTALVLETILMDIFGQPFHTGISAPGPGTREFSESPIRATVSCSSEQLVSSPERHQMMARLISDLTWFFRNSDQMSLEYVQTNLQNALRSYR